MMLPTLLIAFQSHGGILGPAPAAAAELTLGEPHLVDSEAIARDAIGWHLGTGFGFPVWDGEDLSGFVFVGEGALEATFADGSDATALAHALVDAGAEATALAPVAGLQAPWVQPFDMALVISADPAIGAMVRGFAPVTRDGRDWGVVDDEGVWHVVVDDFPGLPRAERLATAALRRRSEQLAAAGIDLQAARVLDEADGFASGREVVEVHSEMALGRLVSAGPEATRWLTWIADPSGTVDGTSSAQLTVFHGPARRRVLATGAPAPLEVAGGLANVVLSPTDSRSVVRVEVTSQLDLVGGEREAGTVVLAVPHELQRAWYGQPEVADGFALQSVTLADGTPLRTLEAPFGSAAPWGTRGDGWEVLRVVLPAPLAPGERLALRISTTDVWQLRHTFEYRFNGVDQIRGMGTVVEPKPVLPVVLGQTESYPAEVRVGTAMPAKFQVVASGQNLREWVEGDARWRSVQVDATDARVGIGRWRGTHVSRARGAPDVRVFSHSWLSGSAPGLAPWVRAFLHAHADLLPAYPLDGIDVIEGPSEWAAAPTTALGARGQVVVRSAVDFAYRHRERTVRTNLPHLELRGIATSLLYDWWAVPAYAPADRWIPAAAVGVYVDGFHRTAWGEQEALDWSRVGQRVLDQHPPDGPVSLTHQRGVYDPALLYEVGTRLLGRALQARLGAPALYGGFGCFLEGAAAGRSATRDLQACLEQTGGQPLHDFFDAWIVMGVRPELDVAWRSDASGLQALCMSDTPFATLEVPVRVSDDGGTRWHTVRVVEGIGRLDLPVRGVATLEVDPERWYPWSALRVRRAASPLTAN